MLHELFITHYTQYDTLYTPIGQVSSYCDAQPIVIGFYMLHWGCGRYDT